MRSATSQSHKQMTIRKVDRKVKERSAVVVEITETLAFGRAERIHDCLLTPGLKPGAVQQEAAEGSGTYAARFGLVGLVAQSLWFFKLCGLYFLKAVCGFFGMMCVSRWPHFRGHYSVISYAPVCRPTL